MTNASIARHPSPRRRAGIYSVLVLALTTIHHAYGALIYRTPWRLHVAVIAPAIALALYLGLRASAKAQRAGKGAAPSYWLATLILLIPVGAIGVFEGGYNHLVKNVLYFRWGLEAMRRFFPSTLYETPSDGFFEITGALQFPLSLVAAYWTCAMLARLRQRVPGAPHPD